MDLLTAMSPLEALKLIISEAATVEDKNDDKVIMINDKFFSRTFR